jgi:hypothetical protein
MIFKSMKIFFLMLLLLTLLLALPGCKGPEAQPAAPGGEGGKQEINRDKSPDMGGFSESLDGMNDLFKEDEFEGIDDF